MEVMRDILLILPVLGVFVFGYFIMARLDKFLDENRKAIERESEKREPSCVMLAEEMTYDEIVEEVHKFREKHEKTRIVLYDCTNTDLSESMVYHTDRKQ